MDRKPLIVEPDNRSAALGVVGTSITVLASNRETGGIGFTLQTGDEGTGPPPHRHPWDEAFFVIEGEVAFTVGEISSRAGAGTLVYVPAGTTHCFAYGPGGGRMLEVTGHGSTAAEMFSQFDAEMTGDAGIPKAVEIFARHGAEMVI